MNFLWLGRPAEDDASPRTRVGQPAFDDDRARLLGHRRQPLEDEAAGRRRQPRARDADGGGGGGRGRRRRPLADGERRRGLGARRCLAQDERRGWRRHLGG